MNVSFAYKIPMLIHAGYAEIAELKEASVYYEFDSFVEKLENKEAFNVIRKKMEQNPNFDKSVQAEKYARFILD